MTVPEGAGRAPGTPQLPGGWFLVAREGVGDGRRASGCAGGGQREKTKDYFKPVLITAPNRDWGWERSCHKGGW